MFKIIYNDAPEPWQMNFQEEATPIACGIVDFHNKAMYYLILIFIMVIYIIVARILSNRSISRFTKINHSK